MIRGNDPKTVSDTLMIRNDSHMFENILMISTACIHPSSPLSLLSPLSPAGLAVSAKAHRLEAPPAVLLLVVVVGTDSHQELS